MSITTTRAHETRIEIDAPIEEVWKALTTAEGLVRWFAPKAEVTPGPGGKVALDWGGPYQWKTAIEVWEPNVRLVLVETRDRNVGPDATPLAPARLIQDFQLESAAGKTMLRLVHSGFGSTSDWDKEYEGTMGGWPCVFFCMRHMLERHRTTPVRNFSVSGPAKTRTREQTRDRIAEIAPQPQTLGLDRKFERVAILTGLNDSIMNWSVEAMPEGGSFYWSQFILFGVEDAVAKRIEKEWRASLEQAFAAYETMKAK